MKRDLGDLSLVDARGVWAHEAADFTPWLTKEENVNRLGLVLGMELEVENTEVAVGPYSADILARDTGSGAYVVIENQLKKINHDHLGKAITYAAALDAGTVVWIAVDFTEEHRRAIDWLNNNSTGDVGFFGVRLEVWQIDSSRPAVRFNVVSRPADAATRAATGKVEVGLSETRKLQLEWWTHFSEALRDTGELPSIQTPKPRYWYDVSIGRTGFTLSNVADTFSGRVGVRVYMRAKYGGQVALRQLLDEKAEIEGELGHSVEWDPNPEASDKTIASLIDADLQDRSKWPEYTEWLVSEVLNFRRVFAPRVKQLDLSAVASREDLTAKETDS